MKVKTLIIITGASLLFAKCNSVKIDKVFKQQTAYEEYASALKESSLDETLLGRKWLSAGKQSLRDSLFIALPYAETGYFPETDPASKVFNFHLKEGSIIKAELNFQGDTGTAIFMDLYKRKESWVADRVESADKGAFLLQYEVDEPGIYTLRIQPELLSKGYYDLRLHTAPVYGFPVSGTTFKSIGSVFGDPRDGGKRRHEGVDIFAKKGTPVVAVAKGRITRVQERGLGGKVVWQWDQKRNTSIYYAHLDSQLVSSGQMVEAGDTLGLVGNTGNAKYTPPHLHFGVYKRGFGARDPYPFLHQPALANFDLTALQPSVYKWLVIASERANIRISPSTKSLVIDQAGKDTPVFVTGAAKDWYNIVLPDQTKGYVHKSVVRADNKPIMEFVLKEKMAVWRDPSEGSYLLGYMEAKKSASIIGKFLDYYLVHFNGSTGWIPKR